MKATQTMPASELGQRIANESAWVGELQGALHEVIVGQEELLHGLLVALLAWLLNHPVDDNEPGHNRGGC